jgi:SH3 domain-containing YSC84-like protein 1
MKEPEIISIALAVVATLIAAAEPPIALAQDREEARVENSGTVITEILNIPESIPDNLLARAPCVVVIPSVLKLAFGFGGSFGRGVMTCRGGPNFNGPWSAPTMMALEGGSFGFQAGAQATDFVLLLMNHRSASAVLSSKVKIGADASAAAGPVGRTAEASLDVTLRAEILSYSRSRGLFAGVSLSGSTLRPDNRANRNLYGKQMNAKEIVLSGQVTPPPAAGNLLATLNKHTSTYAVDDYKDKEKMEIRGMTQDILQKLYKVDPSAQVAVEHANGGYAVFSDKDIKAPSAGSGIGHGIAVNNLSQRVTFMKMVELPARPEEGTGKFRVVFVFDNQKAFDSFVNSGWEFTAPSSPAVKAEEKGNAMSGATQVADGIWIYQLTDDGLASDISVAGTKYSKDTDLN